MGEEFVVDTSYPGYVFVGWAEGQFKTEDGRMMLYANMFVLAPVSTYESEDYKAFGMKADKNKCLSPEVWKDLEIGDRVKLFFFGQYCPLRILFIICLLIHIPCKIIRATAFKIWQRGWQGNGQDQEQQKRVFSSS